MIFDSYLYYYIVVPFRYLLLVLGVLFLSVILFSLTSWPFWILYHWGFDTKPECATPGAIVLLGAAGMPGEGNLMRCYFTADIAHQFPDVPVVIALPGDTSDTTGALHLMRKELVTKGVNHTRIRFENIGTNTRWQALNIRDIPLVDTTACLALVTSPDHMLRSICTFRKAGFTHIYPVTAAEGYIRADLTFTRSNTGGKALIPDVGKNIGLRYRLWTHLKYTILIVRELLALGYYKINGWI